MTIVRKNHVSVVIPTFNRKESLIKAVRSLINLELNSHQLEIIVVDDGSTDGTVDSLSHHFPNETTIRFIRQNNLGPATARNVGVDSSAGEVIFFMDDDCVADRYWICEALKEFSDPLVGGVGGRIRYQPPNGNWANRCAASQDPSGPGQTFERDGSLHHLVTANAAVRKTAFIQVGGFDEEFRHAAQEDIELSLRLLKSGWKLVYCAESIVDHFHDFSMWKIIRRGFQIGRAEKILFKKQCQNPRAYARLIATMAGTIRIFPAFVRNLVGGMHPLNAFGIPFMHRISALAVAMGRLFLLSLTAHGV